MAKFFVKTNQIENNKIIILDEDVNHIKNVLRMEIGDKIQICNLETSENYSCKIENLTEKEIKCDIIEKLESKAESNVHINIFQGLPKADKMELIIQKCTEIGAAEFTPVNLKRCIVKLDSKDEKKKIERWQKIAEVAAKQSKRDIVPKINIIKNLNEVCNLISKYDIVLVAYEEEKQNKLQDELIKIKNINKNYNIAVVIGPEGGIEQEEIFKLKENGAKIITLGNRILRTETAPIVITSNIIYELEN